MLATFWLRLIPLYAFLCWSVVVATSAAEPSVLRGNVVDAATGNHLAARLYIEGTDGEFYHARSADAGGSAVEYDRRRSPQSVEIHTTLSAHPFVASLPPGKYTITAERGKEFFPEVAEVDLSSGNAAVEIRLRRWIDMSEHGWYSGETHVHRGMSELPTAMLADDLNVALPLTHWVTKAFTPPSQGDKNSPEVAPALVKVDDTHVIYPLNTEYEIFTVEGKRHTLGAIFALNQKTPFTQGVPPVSPIARQAHREGALLELDKHNWPWSMMLVPVMDVDLYELTNNHVWRTSFFFQQFGEQPPAYMNIERDDKGMTEQGWLDFTFQNYYALLNCGFRLRPTAGTASGVHPVPLGFGRVYVHLPEGFSYDAWMQGLDQGRSFVTTGPLLIVTANDQTAGTSFRFKSEERAAIHLRGWIESQHPLSQIEVIVSGEVRARKPQNIRTERGSYRHEIEVSTEFTRSGWVAVRCYEQLPNGRVRFAHSSPFHVDMAGRPSVPRKVEVAYFIDRMRAELQRHAGVLPDEALAEYRRALAIYEDIAAAAQ